MRRHIEVSKLVAEKGLHEGRDEEHDCWIIDDDAVRPPYTQPPPRPNVLGTGGG